MYTLGDHKRALEEKGIQVLEFVRDDYGTLYVFCDTGEDKYQRYVTWAVGNDSIMLANTVWGHYFTNRETARRDLYKRAN